MSTTPEFPHLILDKASLPATAAMQVLVWRPCPVCGVREGTPHSQYCSRSNISLCAVGDGLSYDIAALQTEGVCNAALAQWDGKWRNGLTTDPQLTSDDLDRMFARGREVERKGVALELECRAAELRAKAEASIGSDTYRIKHNFAAAEIEKLAEEMKSK